MVEIIKHSSKLSRRNLFIYLLSKNGKVAHLWEAEGWEGGSGEGDMEGGAGAEQQPCPEKLIIIKNRHTREENKIVPPLYSMLCPHSVTPLSPFTRNKKMPKPYTKQNVGILK